MKCVFCETSIPNQLEKFENYNSKKDIYLCKSHAKYYDHIIFYGNKIFVNSSEFSNIFDNLGNHYTIVLIDKDIYNEIIKYKRAPIKNTGKTYLYKDIVLLSLVEYLNDNNLDLTTEVDVNDIVDYFKSYIEQTYMIDYCFTGQKESLIVKHKDDNLDSLQKYNTLFKNKMIQLPIRMLYESTIFESDDKFSKSMEFINRSNKSFATKVSFKNTRNIEAELFKNSIIFTCLKNIEINTNNSNNSSSINITTDILSSELVLSINQENILNDDLIKINTIDDSDLTNEITRFNIFHQNEKYITNKFDFKTMNKSDIAFIRNYIELVLFLEDFLEKKRFLPNITEINNNKDWIDIFNLLTFDTFTNEIYEKFVNDKPVFDMFTRISKTIEGNFNDINEKLSSLIARYKVNAILENLFLTQANILQQEYDKYRLIYINENITAQDLIVELELFNQNIDSVFSNYNKLLSVFDDTIRMLSITKINEIQDIKDYYLYSVGKTIEKRLSIYGTSKNITNHEVDNLINKIETKMYKLTSDQHNAIIEGVRILNDNTTASCLIQGDVSCGKTIVTAALMFLVAMKGLKCVYIVPRKVLRLQHLRTLRKYNEILELDLNIYDSKEYFNIRNADIVVNGYSFKDNMFSAIDFDLGVIDEIQLFGIEQRNFVQKKYPNIDMFYTTATPHPRTKLISLIGNMDIIEIRQLPPGRKLKHTELFYTIEQKHLELVQDEVKKGNMAIVVCPLVNKEGFGEFESIKIAHLKYQKLFPNLRVEKLMANSTNNIKEEIIESAVNGKIDILVATKSIEVGVDIPRATIIFIHHPHSMTIKWGVSQLHQLRGRVGRNNDDAYCFIESPDEINEGSPIHSVLQTQDVFELTNNDFNWRGFEHIIGTKQAGTSGGKIDQQKRIEAYTIIAEQVPKVISILDSDFINKIEMELPNNRIENLN